MEIALAVISALMQLVPEAVQAYPLIEKLIGGTALTADELNTLNAVRKTLEDKVTADAAVVINQQ